MSRSGYRGGVKALGIVAVGVVGAAGGYLVGARREQLVAAVACYRRSSEQPKVRGWDDETEFEHLVEREQAERHRVAEEIRTHPLRERDSGQLDDEDAEALASRPPTRAEPDDFFRQQTPRAW